MDLDILHADFLSLQKLFEPDGSWIRLTEAKKPMDHEGRVRCTPTDPEAVCWCLGGGIERVTEEHEGMGPRSDEMFLKLAEFLGYGASNAEEAQGIVVGWNDNEHRTHREVRELIQRVVYDTKRADEVTS